MTTVEGHCCLCTKPVHLPAHEILLTLHTRQEWRDTYRFNCPHCLEENVRPAPRDVVALLVSAAVRVERVTIPAELEDPARWGAPPISWDDVLDFRSALAAAEELEERWTR